MTRFTITLTATFVVLSACAGSEDAGDPTSAGQCSTNEQCANNQGGLVFCKVATGTCVRCLDDSMCLTTEQCVNDNCVARTGSGGAGGSAPCTGLGTIDDVNECITAQQGNCDCGCQACPCEINACAADQACFDVARCMLLDGCRGNDCYTPDTCQTEIDAVGGPTAPGPTLANQVFTCLGATSCTDFCTRGPT